MATSVYFNNQRATVEQNLLEDLIIESIKNHGIDVYYLPRESQSSFDELFGDDPVKYFRKAIKLEMYLESFQNYEGNQEFFSKFGLEIQDTARLCVARRRFERQVASVMGADRRVPKEGDLIYLPIQFKLMEIKFVQEEKNFFQLGRDSINPYMYGLTVEAFKYNGELLQTGTEEIDRIADLQSNILELNLNAGGTSTFQRFEIVYQGSNLATATAKAIVAGWNLPTQKLKVRNVKGAFVGGTLVKGSTSNAQWTLNGAPDLLNNVNVGNIEDNDILESEADGIIDFTEINPFGEP